MDQNRKIYFYGEQQMPLNRCTLPDGSKGWRWGKQKCYKNKKDAIKQMQAIKISQSKSSYENFKNEVVRELYSANFSLDEALSIANDLGLSYIDKLTIYLKMMSNE